MAEGGASLATPSGSRTVMTFSQTLQRIFRTRFCTFSSAIVYRVPHFSHLNFMRPAVSLATRDSAWGALARWPTRVRSTRRLTAVRNCGNLSHGGPRTLSPSLDPTRNPRATRALVYAVWGVASVASAGSRSAAGAPVCGPR